MHYENFPFYSVLSMIVAYLTLETLCLLCDHAKSLSRLRASLKLIKIRKRKTNPSPNPITQATNRSLCAKVCQSVVFSVIEKLAAFVDSSPSEQKTEPKPAKAYPERHIIENLGIETALKYTRRRLGRSLPHIVSYLRQLVERHIYHNRRYYRFSRQFASTQFICAMLLFFLTSSIVRNSDRILELIYGFVTLLSDWFVNEVIVNKLVNNEEFSENKNKYKQKFAEIKDKYFGNKSLDSNASSSPARLLDRYLENRASAEMEPDFLKKFFNMCQGFIVQACWSTSAIYGTQILLFIRAYQTHVLNAYRGVFDGIPPPSDFSHLKTVSSSIRFRFDTSLNFCFRLKIE